MNNIIKNKWIYGIISVSILIIAWEFISVTNVIPPLYIGTPHIIVKKIWEIFNNHNYTAALWDSVSSFFISYTAALVFGGLFGLFLGVSERVRKFISPYIYIFNTIPYIAILPLFIIWLGVGFKAKILVAFLMIVSPVLIYTIDSTRTINKNYLAMAKSFGANRFFILKNVYFYHSLPYILSGGRTGVGRGVSAIIVSEIYGLGRGTGYYVAFFGTTYQTEKLMALVILIVIFNLILLTILKRIQKRLNLYKG